jgi:hypothetical protein
MGSIRGYSSLQIVIVEGGGEVFQQRVMVKGAVSKRTNEKSFQQGRGEASVPLSSITEKRESFCRIPMPSPLRRASLAVQSV